MTPDHPFEPPADLRSEDLPTRAAGVVVATWAVCGACVGAAVGATLQLTGQLPGGAGVLGVAGVLVFGLGGALSIRAERRHAASRPEVLDAHGRPGRPLHGLLYVAPILVAIPMLLWLVVVGSVAADSLLPGFAFGMLAVALAWGALKAWAGHQMTRALEALEVGEREVAIRQLQALQGNAFAPRSARLTARLSLGSIALEEGRLDDATSWFSTTRRGQAAAFAAAGLALVHILGDRLDAAEEEVQLAMSSPSARLVQPQLDTVRLLLVWRREGERSALILGERLLSGESASLFLALLATLRERAGDRSGAAELRAALDGPVALADRVPELSQTA